VRAPPRAEEGPLDLGADRKRLVERRCVGSPRRIERARQLEQGERVPSRQRHELVRHPLGEAGRPLGEQRLRGCGRQTVDGQLRQPFGREDRLLRLARGEEQHDSLGMEPTGREHERLGRGVVEPVRVVDDTEEWALAGRTGKQGQRRRGDDEPLGHRPVLQGERGAERARLMSRQLRERVHDRSQELLQPCECDLRLGLDTERTQNAKSLGPLDGML